MGQLFAQMPDPGTHQEQDSAGAPTDRSRKVIFCVSTLNHQTLRTLVRPAATSHRSRCGQTQHHALKNSCCDR